MGTIYFKTEEERDKFRETILAKLTLAWSAKDKGKRGDKPTINMIPVYHAVNEGKNREERRIEASIKKK